MNEDLEELRQEIKELQQQMEMIPLESGGRAAGRREIAILDGQEIDPNAADGIKYSASTVSLVDDDPETSGTRSDGMGRGQYLDTGEKVMIVHDNAGPTAQTTPLKAGDIGISVDTRSSSGGTVYHYIAGT